MSSSSLKSLMAQKKQSTAAKLSHPFASYDRQNRLTCKLCAGVSLKHENLWSSHLVSKGHRTNAKKWEKEQELIKQRDEEQQQITNGKRRREDDEDEDDDDVEEGTTKRTREDEEEAVEKSSLPSDFFTDPSEAPTTLPSHKEFADNHPAADEATTIDVEAGQDDPEWAEFEASLKAESEANAAGVAEKNMANATISGSAVVYEYGAPKVAEEGEEEGQEEEEEEEEETEEERRERLDREEREEIMQRIEAEEREQLEADAKVTALKRKMELLKEARRKRTGAAAGTST